MPEEFGDTRRHRFGDTEAQLSGSRLQAIGYQPDWVSNGLEAIALLKQKEYDVILMDCQMPEMDGYEATRVIRQREGSQRHTIIIGLTAHVMKGDRQKCLDAGMDDYLSKPIDLDKLIKILDDWLQTLPE